MTATRDWESAFSDSVQEARKARKNAQQAVKAAAKAKPKSSVPVTAGDSHRSAAEKALYALLLKEPDLCARLYQRLVCTTVWASGTALQGALICDVLYPSNAGSIRTDVCIAREQVIRGESITLSMADLDTWAATGELP